MNIRKVTSDKFAEVKAMLAYSRPDDVAQRVNLSVTTVHKINNSDSYEDYLDYVKGVSTSLAQRVREMGLSTLTGEPLFWKIHADCKAIPIHLLASSANLSCDVVKTMKKAPDYETFLKMKGKIKYRPRTETLSQGTREQIKKMASDGYTDAEIRRLLNVSQDLVACAKALPDNKDRVKVWLNEGLYDIIKAGIVSGISYSNIKKELPISYSTYLRVRNGECNFAKVGVSRKDFSDFQKGERSTAYHKLQTALDKWKNYEEFSCQYYAGVPLVSWAKDSALVPEERLAKPVKEIPKPAKVMPQNKTKSKIRINEGLYDIIRAGIAKKISYQTMRKTLPISYSTYVRIKGGRMSPASASISRKDFAKFQSGEYTTTNAKLRRALGEWKNYEEFSLNYYAEVPSVSWLKTVITPSEKKTFPSEVTKATMVTEESTADKPIKEAPEVEDVVENEPAEEPIKNEPIRKDKPMEETDPSTATIAIWALLDIQTSMNEVAKFKYRGIFALIAFGIICATGVAVLAVLK